MNNKKLDCKKISKEFEKIKSELQKCWKSFLITEKELKTKDYILRNRKTRRNNLVKMYNDFIETSTNYYGKNLSLMIYIFSEAYDNVSKNNKSKCEKIDDILSKKEKINDKNLLKILPNLNNSQNFEEAIVTYIITNIIGNENFEKIEDWESKEGVKEQFIGFKHWIKKGNLRENSIISLFSSLEKNLVLGWLCNVDYDIKSVHKYISNLTTTIKITSVI